MSQEPATTLKRAHVHPTPLVDGRRVRNGASGRMSRRLETLLVSRGERDEAEVEQRMRSIAAVSRPNVVALISPKGGVGKTTSTFLVGNLLASHLKLRAIAIDANSDFGTLGRVAGDARQSQRSLVELLEDADRLRTAAQLNAYVSRQPTGMHVLAAPRDPTATADFGPDHYGELVAFLSCFYEVVLLDLGAGVAGPLARFAIDRADQAVLVTTPEWVTSSVVLDALEHMRHDRTTVVLNKSLLRAIDLPAVEQRFRMEHLHGVVTVPYDEQLATMLDAGHYTLDALRRRTRLAIKRLGLAVAQQLV